MNYERDKELFSKAVKAGRRTYFFDIKSTRGNDLFLTITESKKTTYDGVETFQKHKVFLYKEDFQNFKDALEESLEQIDKLTQDRGDEDKSASIEKEIFE